MPHNVIHISEAEAKNDFASVLERVRAGAEVVIDAKAGGAPIAVVRYATPEHRTIPEALALARRHEEEAGESPVLDPDFAADVLEIVRNRKPWNPSTWD